MSAYVLGDSLAFEELFRRYKKKVYGYVSQKLFDKSLVDDVFQNTFIRLHNSRNRYVDSLPFAPWLFAICRNSVLDTFKAEGRRKSLAVSIAKEVAAESPDSSEPPSVDELVTHLPKDSADAIRLRYVDELDFNEISIRLGKSPTNVRQIISRAIRALRGNKND